MDINSTHLLYLPEHFTKVARFKDDSNDFAFRHPFQLIHGCAHYADWDIRPVLFDLVSERPSVQSRKHYVH